MAVLRIVANVAVPDPAQGQAFYGELLGLDLAMDLGWIQTFAAAPVRHRPQLSLMSEGGSGTPVPDLSIEVDDVEAVLARVRARGLPLEYGPADEPWGVRRFYLRDPFGRLINILQHR